MKKLLSLLLCFVILAVAATGCAGVDGSDAASVVSVDAPSDTDGSAADAGSEAGPAESADPVESGETGETGETEKFFTFKPKVCSSFMEGVLGTAKRDAWFSLVDAVMAGEDTFDCPDKHTLLWMLAEFPNACFPVLKEILYSPNALEVTITDGRANIVYKVPKEEAAQKIEEFKQLVEDILNEVLRPDYSDFEKALALYCYFAKTYTYDYDTAALIENGESSKTGYVCAYRLLTTRNGICSEISVAYSYLLMQAGVDASVVFEKDHEWSIINLGGKYYHIDPTFVLSSQDYLGYFLMTDEWRGYRKDKLIYVADYHPEEMPDYTCDDETFKPLWKGWLNSFDHDAKTLEYRVYVEDDATQNYVFDYSPY